MDAGKCEGLAPCCTEPDACQPAQRVEVRINHLAGEGTIRGEWRRGMHEGSERESTIAADTFARPAICS